MLDDRLTLLATESGAAHRLRAHGARLLRPCCGAAAIACLILTAAPLVSAQETGGQGGAEEEEDLDTPTETTDAAEADAPDVLAILRRVERELGGGEEAEASLTGEVEVVKEALADEVVDATADRTAPDEGVPRPQLRTIGARRVVESAQPVVVASAVPVAVPVPAPAVVEAPATEATVVTVVPQRPMPREPFRFQWPVDHVRITSSYGIRRDPKNRKRRKMHKGLDFGGAVGTAVKATGPGKVIHAGWGQRGVGICVIVQHPNNWISLYFHLSKVEVSAGDIVEAGETVGRIGSTGRSTGPHLHFQVQHAGKVVDPKTVIGKMSNKVK